MRYAFSDPSEKILADAEALKRILDCILENLPDRFEAARDLLMTSATFREICDDYARIQAILQKNCRTEGTLPEICEHASDLAGELEEEILRALNSSPGR